MKTRFYLSLFLVLTTIFCGACNTSDVKDAIDITDVERHPIDTTRLGVNAFFNDGRFGTIPQQMAEIKNTLRLSFIRVLFAWNDGVQQTPGSRPNFSFYDSILNAVPEGMDVLVLVTGIPSWMKNSANWSNGDPRATFAESWVRPVVARYGNNPKVIAFEIWNEPNNVSDPDNAPMEFIASADNYVALLGHAFSIVNDLAPSKRVVSAATTAINQNFPETLDYNRAMRDAGAENFLDIWGIHYYGKQYENVVRDNGVADYLNGLSKSIWITESGAQGVNNQLAYGEEVWPFLRDKVPGIDRIYQYQFAEATPSDVTYGLRNLTPGATLTDLYISLRDRG